jgi:vacuolar protein sorting-associated protein 45
MAQKTVLELQRRIGAEPGLFDFRKQEVPPLLLVLDRRDDPATPLLTQWTYQAMVHELLGIKNSRVDLSGVHGISKEMQEIVLSSEQDPWYKQCMYLNFGDLGVKIKELVDDFQSKTKSNQNIQSIDDIKRFVEDYPLFRKLSGNVTKHVTLMGELSRIIDERQLLKVSEVEQDLANNHAHDNHLRAISALFNEPKIRKEDLLKLVLLYAMRYEDDPKNEVTQFVDKLNQIGVSAEQRELIAAITQYASSGVRTGDVFRNKSKIIRGIQLFKRGVNGVENIYMEHKPLLKEILDNILANKLKDTEYPFAYGQPTKEVPQEIIVFIVGGVTYEEASTVHDFNAMGSGVRIILGGSHIHNSRSFLEDVAKIRTLSFR